MSLKDDLVNLVKWARSMNYSEEEIRKLIKTTLGDKGLSLYLDTMYKEHEENKIEIVKPEIVDKDDNLLPIKSTINQLVRQEEEEVKGRNNFLWIGIGVIAFIIFVGIGIHVFFGSSASSSSSSSYTYIDILTDPIVGEWTGYLEGEKGEITLVFTNNNMGYLTANEPFIFHTLTWVRVIGTYYRASYAWKENLFGQTFHQERTMEISLLDDHRIYVEIYNQFGQKIRTGIFYKTGQ